jgi:hypothetical protein
VLLCHLAVQAFEKLAVAITCCLTCCHCLPLLLLPLQAGDVLILTKPLGVGVMTTALKKGLLPPEGYEEVRQL